MMMEVSATSLLVILGIFCSAASAQPSPGLQQAVRCMQLGVRQCVMPVLVQYDGMNLNQILNQIRTTDLAQTCAPVLTAQQCIVNKVSECRIEEFDHPDVVAKVRLVRLGTITVNYICRDRVEVFNEHKECLLDPDGSEDAREDMEQCVRRLTRPGPNYRPVCILQEFPDCVANVIEQECGEEIANEFRSLGQQLVAEGGCSTRKLFKMMKKEMYSPMELMDKAFPSFF